MSIELGLIFWISLCFTIAMIRKEIWKRRTLALRESLGKKIMVAVGRTLSGKGTTLSPEEIEETKRQTDRLIADIERGFVTIEGRDE